MELEHVYVCPFVVTLGTPNMLRNFPMAFASYIPTPEVQIKFGKLVRWLKGEFDKR